MCRGNRLESDIIGPCQFMDGHKRASVGLMSIPGSGNTWFRAILEAATGICTGKYCKTDNANGNIDLNRTQTNYFCLVNYYSYN